MSNYTPYLNFDYEYDEPDFCVCPKCNEQVDTCDCNSIEISGEWFHMECAKEGLINHARDYIKSWPAALDALLTWLGDDLWDLISDVEEFEFLVGDDAPTFRSWLSC